MMRQLAQDLKTSQQQTQTTADQAKAEKPVAEVAQQAQDLQPQTTANTQRMEALQSALRQRFSRRLGAANLFQGLLGHPLGRGLMNGLGRSGLLPFRSLLSLVRQ
jgi:hypothetical protein